MYKVPAACGQVAHFYWAHFAHIVWWRSCSRPIKASSAVLLLYKRNAVCCDVAGELSESQKQELEQYQATVQSKEAELVEVRQQLAKLSEILDRQTDDMKQLNIETRFDFANVVSLLPIK